MTTFAEYIAERFGVLTSGSHTPDGAACALEARSQYERRAWTDAPSYLDMPDLRPLNDAPWSSDAARTAAMAPMLMAVAPVWRSDKRQAWVKAVVLATVREIIAELPGLPSDIAVR